MSASVQVGRLSVHPSRSGLGQGVVARSRAEALLATLDLRPPDPLDRSVLVLRGVRWAAERGLSITARAEVAHLARHAVRPAHADGINAEAVVFRDDVELLQCLTLDALAGQLSRWYWRRLAPVRSGRIGAVLAAAWTERARWLPAALADLPLADAIRGVSALSPNEVQVVRQALLSAFDFDAPSPPGAQTSAADPTHPCHYGQQGDEGSSLSWPPEPESSRLDAEQHQLLLLALGLRHQPGTVRRAPEAPLPAVLRGIAADDPRSAAPQSDHPVSVQAPCFDTSEGVFSRFASALYLINLASWLQVLTSWAGVELLARHLIGSVEVDDWDRDPLWAILAELNGREPGTDPFDPAWSPRVAWLAVEALTDRTIPTSALMQPGRIVVSATHVDVVLDLQGIDIHVRMAGLDRDPGWVPDLARIVAFHFEDGIPV